MANQVDIGNNTILIIKIPARGATDWAAEFKTNFADSIAEHDHTTGKGARITNAALVTNTMVTNGNGVTKVDGTFTAYTSADVAVSTDTIQDLAVTTAKIADDAVDGTKIADNSITSAHIAADVVIDADIAPDSVGTSELKVDAVETENILDANVTTAKIADANVTTAKIADSNVTTAKIADANVTTAKIADANVTTAKLANNSVTNAKMGSDIPLATLSNVSSTSPTTGQVLKWSGTEWAPGTDASSSGSSTLVVAKLTSDQSASGIIQFDSVEIDLGTDYSSSTGQFTAPSAGYYEVHCEVGFDAYSSTYMTEAHLDDAVEIYKNSSAVYNHLPYLDIRYEGPAQTFVSYNYTYIVNLAQNDIITIRTKDLTAFVNDTIATAPSLLTIKKL